MEITKRRRFFKVVPQDNKKNIQYRYMMLIMVAELACILISFIGFNIVIMILKSNSMDVAYSNGQYLKITLITSGLFLIFAAVAILAGALLSLNLSHKFVGPLYRIELMLKEILDTDKPLEIRIRQDDELQFLTELLNRLIEKKVTK